MWEKNRRVERKIESQGMLVRDIIDIDSTYEDFEASDEDELKSKKSEDKKQNQKMKMIKEGRKRKK